MFTEARQAVYEASKPKVQQTPVERDRYGAHDRLAKCLVAFKAQFSRGDHRPDPFILLKAIASNDLWIWHAFFGVSGMNNDVNVLRQSPIFNDLKSGRVPDVPFVANNVLYKRGYYLTDGIYPQWSKWKQIKYPARGMSRSRLSDVMHTCIILHNMIIHDNGNAISPDFFPEEQHRDDDPAYCIACHTVENMFVAMRKSSFVTMRKGFEEEDCCEPKTAEGDDKPNDIMESVISCKTAKATWTDLVHCCEGPSYTKENRIMDLKLE
ncbi:ALP1-like protein [Tanacetum coccineum]